MFKSMRSGKNKTMTYIVLGLLMLGLTGFGIGGLGGSTVRTIGSVGDEEISVDSYARTYRNVINQMSQRFGRTLSPSEVQQLGLSQAALDAVIGTAAVDNEAAARGISVGDQIVRRTIVENPRFQGQDGKFDKQAYDYFLDRSVNLQASEFDTLLRKENARSLLEGSVAGGVSTSDTVPLVLVRYVRETRDFEWAWVTSLQLSEPVGTPTDAQAKAFYDSHADLYQSLETHNITYAWLSPDMLLDQVDLSEAEIREAYDAQPDRFNKAERRIVDRLVFPNAEDAAKARNDIDGQTTTFEALTNDRGLTASDIDMGEIEVGDLSIKAEELVFGTDEPGIVGPVDSSIGPALFRINAILAKNVTSFEDARDIIRKELAADSASRLVSDKLTALDDSLAAGATLEQMGEETDMVSETMDYTAQSTGGIADFAAFRNAIQNASKGDFPELTDLADGGIFALRVNSVTPPALIPLAEVSDRVNLDWTAQETQKKLQELAQDFKTKLDSGQSFADLQLGPNAETGVTRNQTFQGLPSQAMTDLFGTDIGKVVMLDGNSGVFLARLTRITELDPADKASQLLVTQLTRSLGDQIGADAFELYTAALRKRAGVDLNQGALNSVNSQIASQ